MKTFFSNGMYDDESDKITCGHCGYIGEPETDIDMQNGNKELMCPKCLTLIGTVKTKEAAK